MNNQMNVSIGETIKPFNTFVDGDVFYTCSTNVINNKMVNTEKIKFFNQCSSLLKEAIENSIL